MSKKDFISSIFRILDEYKESRELKLVFIDALEIFLEEECKRRGYVDEFLRPYKLLIHDVGWPIEPDYIKFQYIREDPDRLLKLII